MEVHSDMSDRYILHGTEVVPEPDLMAWGKWMEEAERLVRSTEIQGIYVSTVFLGLDHNFGGGPPLVFETMVFDKNDEGGYCERCSTWAQAEIQHTRACEIVREGLKL
jgi:hypothetical protein